VQESYYQKEKMGGIRKKSGRFSKLGRWWGEDDLGKGSWGFFFSLILKHSGGQRKEKRAGSD